MVKFCCCWFEPYLHPNSIMHFAQTLLPIWEFVFDEITWQLACQNENWIHGKINVGFWYIKYIWQILKHFAVEHFIKHKLWNCKEVYTQLSIIWNTRTTKNGAGPKVPFHTLIRVCKNECAKKILCTSFGTGIHFILFNDLTKNVFIIFSLLFLKTTTIVSSINNGKDRSFKMLP